MILTLNALQTITPGHFNAFLEQIDSAEGTIMLFHCST